jgi:membrane associated rhomboid family serine protease
MIPYRDENQTQRTPVVTLALIAINVLVWIFFQHAGQDLAVATSVCNYGLIPGELTGVFRPGDPGFPMGDGLVCLADPGRQFSHLITSMFLHGSWMHLIGNMWFLWLFGNNIEDSMTRPRFAAFYLICGLAAAFTQVAANAGSNVPMVGASGAISGVMGAYLILYPRVRVYTLVPLGFFFWTIALPAWVMLLYWAFLQLASGVVSLAGSEIGGVAVWAHLGGFAAGILLIKLFENPDSVAAHRAQTWAPRQTRRALWG